MSSRALTLPSTAGVYCIYGALGGGKSLSAVAYAVDEFLNRRNFVCSNILLKNLDAKQRSHYMYLDDVRTVDWFKLPVGSPRGSGGKKRVAVILDEMPELINQYSNGKEVWIQAFLSWLRHTSKNGQFVFFISQRPEFLLKAIRLLCCYNIRCDDLAQVRLPLFRVKIPFCSGYVSRRIYDQEGQCLNHKFDLISKRLYGRYYDTAQGLSLYKGDSVPDCIDNAEDRYDALERLYGRLFRYSLFSLSFFFFVLMVLIL